MNSLFRLKYIIIAFTFLLLGGTELRAEPTDRLRHLQAESNQACERRDYWQLLRLSPEYVRLAKQSGNDRYISAAFFCEGVAKMYTGTGDAEQSLNSAIEAALRSDDAYLAALALNAKGILKGFYQGHHAVGQRFFILALDYLHNTDDPRGLDSSIYGNLSEIAIAQNDTSGMQWARMAREAAKKHPEPHTESNGAYLMAYHYYMRGDNAKASRKLQEAIKIYEKNGYAWKTELYVLSGMIAFQRGDSAEADRMFEKASELSNKENNRFAYLGLLCMKSRLRQYEGETAESDKLAQECLQYADSLKIHYFDRLATDILAENAEKRKDYESAVKWQKKRNRILDSDYAESVKQLQRERKMLLDVEQERTKRIEQGLRTEYLHKVVICITVALLICLFLIFLLIRAYRRKQLLYKNIVKQHQSAIFRENDLKKQLTVMQSERQTASADTENEISDDKAIALWLKIQELMEKERLFTDPLLSRDALLERLGTNRTYLAQVLRTQGHTTLPKLITGFRIRSVIEILNDSTATLSSMREVWEKCGFTSESAFYKSFNPTLTQKIFFGRFSGVFGG